MAILNHIMDDLPLVSEVAGSVEIPEVTEDLKYQYTKIFSQERISRKYAAIVESSEVTAGGLKIKNKSSVKSEFVPSKLYGEKVSEISIKFSPEEGLANVSMGTRETKEDDVILTHTFREEKDPASVK